MKTIARVCFPKATQVTNRFHVQKLAKQKKIAFIPETFDNGDTRKQLLARSRYLLYKTPSKWTENQYFRSKILFKEYPDIKVAFNLVQGLRNIFNQAMDIKVAYTKLAHWYKDVEESGFKSFQTVANRITLNYRSVLNYFLNRSTNASAESFNAKIKAFRSQFRGVRNTEYFLYRLSKLYS